MLGLSIWWKIDSYSGLSDKRKSEKLKSLDKEFLSLMDNSIVLSKKVYEQGNKIDGAFFLAASYGFKGRLLSERRKWRAAAFAGMNALKYLKEIRKDDIMIPEISFGNGLFNYYSIWISDRFPLLKPIVALFPKGDKKLGIDPFDKMFNANYLYKRISNSQSNIKAIIMNQKIILGIGNIYASEILFDSKISPLKRGRRINKGEAIKLLRSIFF